MGGGVVVSCGKPINKEKGQAPNSLDHISGLFPSLGVVHGSSTNSINISK